MDCRETLLLISPHLDGALSKDEEAALIEHVAVCEDCARELDLQKRLSGALRNLGREEIQAPQELCGLVMAKLRAERRGTILRLPAAWRKAAAAAAAVLIIAAGYAGFTAGLIDSGKTLISENVKIEPDNRVTPDKISKDLDQPDGSVQPPENNGSPVITGEGNATDSAHGKGTGNSTNTDNNISDNGDSSKTPAVNTSRPSSEGPSVLLSSGIKETNTELRMAVDDLPGARAKAVALAAGTGAETQVFPEQSGGKKMVFIRITTTSDQAPGLVAELTRMGKLMDRNDGSTDFTSIYNETLVQYHDLQSRISSARDAGEKSQLEAQAASQKQQLDNWESKAGKRVIMLWLESK